MYMYMYNVYTLSHSYTHTHTHTHTPGLTTVVQVENFSSFYLEKYSILTMACSSTQPMTHTLFKSAPRLLSFKITWTGLDLLAGSWDLLLYKDSCWMHSSQGLCTKLYCLGEQVIHTCIITCFHLLRYPFD